MPLSQLSRSIEGSVAFITGAASGMGEATAKLFASNAPKCAKTSNWVYYQDANK